MHNVEPRRWVVLGAVPCIAAVLGCGGGAEQRPRPGMPPEPTAQQSRPSEPAHARGADAATAHVGPAGGTLELSSGARLEIERGALEQPEEVTLRVGADSRAFANREDEEPIGPIVQIEPALTAGGSPFRVSVPFAHMPSGYSQDDLAVAVETVADEQRAFEGGAMRTRWQYFPARVEGRRLIAELPELPGMRVQFVASR